MPAHTLSPAVPRTAASARLVGPPWAAAGRPGAHVRVWTGYVHTYGVSILVVSYFDDHGAKKTLFYGIWQPLGDTYIFIIIFCIIKLSIQAANVQPRAPNPQLPGRRQLDPKNVLILAANTPTPARTRPVATPAHHHPHPAPPTPSICCATAHARPPAPAPAPSCTDQGCDSWSSSVPLLHQPVVMAAAAAARGRTRPGHGAALGGATQSCAVYC